MRSNPNDYSFDLKTALMKFVGRSLGICVVALFGGAVATAASDTAFLKVLRDNNYGDVAVDYLKVLEKRSDIPDSVKDVFDLEMARSLRAAATNAYNAADAESLNAEAQKYLDKFLKEKPDHPLAFEAMADSAAFAKTRGLTLLRNAETATEPAKKTQFLADARKAFEDAKPKFKESYEKFRGVVAKMPTPKRTANLTRRERESLETYFDAVVNLAAARYELALTGYYLAQTYADPKDPARIAALKDASKALDAIWQDYRYVESDQRGEIGLFAHMWQGRVCEELGQLETALDVYDEVLALAPDPNEPRATGDKASARMEALFTQVQRFRLGILAKTKPAEYENESVGWLEDYNKRLKSTDGYAQIAMDLVNFLLAKAEKAPEAEKKDILADAKKACGVMAKTPGPRQGEFRKLMNEKFGGGEKVAITGDPKSFEEAVSFGESAYGDSNYDEAEKQFTKAFEFYEKPGTKKKKEDLDKVRDLMAKTIYMKAHGAFRKDPALCLKLAAQVMTDYGETPTAPAAGALRVQVQLYIYGTADPKKPDVRAAALADLEKFAKDVEAKWPGNEVADDARIALGQACLVRDDLPGAIENFKRCNPKSDRYAAAMQYLGTAYWRRCLLENQKPQADRKADQMKSDAEEAAGALDKCVKLLKSQLDKKKGDDAKTIQKTMVDMHLMLADIYNFSNEPAKAAEALKPLVDMVKAAKAGEEIDPTTLRVAVGAVRSFLAANQLENATEIGLVLNEVGPDNQQVNGVLILFARQLDNARKQADADKIQSAGDAAKVKAAEDKLAAVQKALRELLPKLAQRKAISVNTMVMLGDYLAAAELNDLASAQYEKILKEHGSDKDAAKAMLRVRVQLVGLLKKKGDYKEADAQMKEIVKKQPNALDALMEEARILQAWADSDKSKWDEAAAKWNSLMSRLKNVKNKDERGKDKKPEEFFEVTYNLALCLANDAARTSDKATAEKKFLDARKTLKSTLFYDPHLSGPDMVAKYNVLIDKLNKALNQTESGKPKADKPK